jgi:beta-fructofuranosidase
VEIVGNYHLFYLYNPDAPIWRWEKYWGHAVSRDLVHWQYLPVALSPTPTGPEQHCCQSGSVLERDGVPTAVYTCGWPHICVATGDDEDKLEVWRRVQGNPVIASPPPDLKLTGFRDPFVWKEGNIWYMLVGSGIEGSGGTALLYASKDIFHWEYVHPLFVGDTPREMWEDPSLFRLNGRWMFLYSPTPESRFSRYYIGAYSNQRFAPASQHSTKIDLGEYFYAGSTLLDNRRRQILIGWIREGRSRELTLKAGWSGALSMPRLLSLRSNDVLSIEPIPQIRQLRTKHVHFPNGIRQLSKLLAAVRGDSLEIVAKFSSAQDGKIGIKVRASPDMREETLIGYDSKTKYLFIDGTRASITPGVDHKRMGEMFELQPNERLQLDIFLDHSIVEVFANGRACVTSRIYPALPDSLGVDLLQSGNARLVLLDIWYMKPIWE